MSFADNHLRSSAPWRRRQHDMRSTHGSLYRFVLPHVQIEASPDKAATYDPGRSEPHGHRAAGAGLDNMEVGHVGSRLHYQMRR